MTQNTNEVVLSSSQKNGLKVIADLIHTSILKRDEVLHLSADKMQELLLNVDRKQWELLFKGLKDSLINLCKIGSGTANNYATEISDILTARNIVKPSSDNIKAKQKQARKEALAKEYQHVAKESLIKQLSVEKDVKKIAEITKVIADKAKDEAKVKKDADTLVTSEAKTKWNTFSKALFETEPELCALIIDQINMVRDVVKGN
jgi:hypothetical protein